MALGMEAKAVMITMATPASARRSWASTSRPFSLAEAQVQKSHVERDFLYLAQGPGTTLDGDNLVSIRFQRYREHPGDVAFVIDNQNSHGQIKDNGGRRYP